MEKITNKKIHDMASELIESTLVEKNRRKINSLKENKQDPEEIKWALGRISEIVKNILSKLK